jgi:hypothetical protein
VSTINGDANVPFYKELGNQKISAQDIPVIAFSVGEEELSGVDTKPLLGHMAAWNYFQSVNTPANKAFIDQWHTFIKNPKRTTNDPMEAHYIGFNLWIKAVQKAGTVDVAKVIAALPGLETPNLTGGTAKLLANHHITKPVLIGEVRADGQFNVVSKSPGLVEGDAWSDFPSGQQEHCCRLGESRNQLRKLQYCHQEVFRTKLQIASPPPRKGGQLLLLLLLALLGVGGAHAQTPNDSNFLSILGELREASYPDKEAIVERLSQTNHPSIRPVLTAFMEDRLLFKNDDQKIFIAKTTEGDPPTLDLIDPISLKVLDPRHRRA